MKKTSGTERQEDVVVQVCDWVLRKTGINKATYKAGGRVVTHVFGNKVVNLFDSEMEHASVSCSQIL